MRFLSRAHIIAHCDLIIFVSLLTNVHKGSLGFLTDKGETDWLQRECCHGPTWHVRRQYQRWNNGRSSGFETARGGVGVGGSICWYEPKVLPGHWLNIIFLDGKSWRDKSHAGRRFAWPCGGFYNRKSDIFPFYNTSHHPQRILQGGSIN